MISATLRQLINRTLLPVQHLVRVQSNVAGSVNLPKPGVKHPDSIFDKIIKREIPAEVIYEDEICIAFNDVSPQAPVHFLVIPKHKIDKLENSTSNQVEVQQRLILGHLLHVAGQLGKSKAPKGFRLVINNGDHGCQTVFHIHLHVIGGRQLGWPPGDALSVPNDSDTPAKVVDAEETRETGSSFHYAKQSDDNDYPKTSFFIDANDSRNAEASHSTRINLKVRLDHRLQNRSSPYRTIRPSALLTSRFLEAVSHNNTEKVKEMIQQGMSPNTYESYFNRSALHIACSRGFRDIVRVLLENGANPNIRDKNLNTPLHLASSTESVEVVQMLLDYGTNVLLRDSNGLLALDFSIGKLRLSERIISKMQMLTQSDIHKHREKTAVVCERIFAVFKQQIRNLDLPRQGLDQEKLEQMLNDFSQQLGKVRQRQIDFDSIVDQISNLKVKSEIDSDVNLLLSTLQQITL
uniref:HIT domain-containing protein n=1 Tax=Anopheles christyi TaxID=43041 RepID=A0A182JTV9_9DIPT